MSESKDNEKEMLSEQELYDVLEFARRAYNGNYSNVFTPDLINQRMKDVNLNPLASTQEKVTDALKDPKNNEENLIGYSEFFELTSMIYKRMLYYLSNLLSFSVIDLICVNAEYDDYEKPAYKKDYEKVCDFLDKFNIKQEFSKVMRELLRTDAAFFIFRDDGNKYILQELPQQYCKITGRWDYGLLFDFNMYWFLQPGVDISMYPDVFKKKFNEVMYDNNGNYIPSAEIDHRNGTWVLWTQTSPEDGFFAWKLTPEISARIPYLAPLFQDVALQPLMRNLQTNKYMIEATKAMIGLIPMIKDPKGGRVKDMVAISAETAGNFLNLIKQGIGEAIKIGAAPFEDVKTLDFNVGNDNILENYTKVTAAMSGRIEALIYRNINKNSLELREHL